MIFDSTTLQQLNQISLIARRVRAGLMKGDRRSSRRGRSVEFADFRSYVPGDELRLVDWNVYARLDQPFVKLLEAEEDLSVYLLLDGSRSMDWGAGETHKGRFALHLAAALGAVALSTGDRVALTILQSAHAIHLFGPSRGQGSLLRLLQALSEVGFEGKTDLNRALRAFLRRPRQPGLVIVISDLLTPDGHEAGFRLLRARGHDVVLLHTLAPEEIDPPMVGDLSLVDAETGQTSEVTLDETSRSLYRARVAHWRRAVRAEALAQGVRAVSVVTDQPWERFVLYELRRAGVVR